MNREVKLVEQIMDIAKLQTETGDQRNEYYVAYVATHNALCEAHKYLTKEQWEACCEKYNESAEQLAFLSTSRAPRETLPG